MLEFYKDGFIGDECANSTTEWHGGKDTEEQFISNLKTNDRILNYYNTKKLTYEFNEYGHRSKNVTEIDLDNYILFVGCSHTSGVGNYLEDTYPYLVSKQLNIDYYNLSISGSGIDVQLHNLFNWLVRYKPPKYLVWQWTLEPRVVIADRENKLQVVGSWSNIKEHTEFLLVGKTINYFKTKRELAKNTVDNLPIKTIQIDIFPNLNAIFYQKIDSARDLLHYGCKSNRIISNAIVNRINIE